MAIVFPTSLDTLSNPSSGDKLNSPSHSTQHGDANDAIEAIEAKLGVGASTAGSATTGHTLVRSAGGTTTWTQVGSTGITAGTATSGQVLTASTGGTAIWSTPTAPGLVQIVPTSVAVGSGSGSVNSNGSVDFTGASSVSLNGIFSSTYRNYRLVFNLTANTASLIRGRFRSSGTDNSSATYNFTSQQINGASWTDLGNATNDTTIVLFYNSGSRSCTSIDIYSPQESVLTNYVSTGIYERLGTFAAGYFNNTTQFDGLSFFPTGTISGSVAIYGYRN